MNKKKIRFNLVDLFIIIVVAAVVFLLLYIFVFSGNKNQVNEVNYTNIQYVIEIQDVDKSLEDAVAVGLPVQDAVEKRGIGTVCGVQAVPYQKLTFNSTTDSQTVSEVENKITLKITVEAQAIETDRAFTVGGCIIRVGEQYSIAVPGFYGSGYCTYIGNARQ